MAVIQTPPYPHVGSEIVQGYEEEISRWNGWPLVPPTMPAIPSALAHSFTRIPGSARLLGRLGADRSPFAVLMGIYRLRTVAWRFLRSRGPRVAYLFDAWPSSYGDIARVCRRYRIALMMVSSRQATEELAPTSTGTVFRWVPEALPDWPYACRSAGERTIDVLQLGRRHDAYHQRIAEGCRAKGIRYRYEKERGELIFPTREQLVRGLGDARISVCFPGDLTHPERCGHISALTLRYLQSMASGCLIVGSLPVEAKELFDYEPVIEADMDNPFDQLISLLEHYEQYVPLVERNRREVLDRHTLRVRCARIREVVNDRLATDNGR